jgi:superoxide reductase
MAERLQVYKCDVCGNIIEFLHGGKGELLCCQQPLKYFKENTVDAAKEKHVPVIEKAADGYIVKVGAASHPMETEHYIEWVELIADNVVYRKYLNPGEDPQASFKVTNSKVEAREYCNKHGLWKAGN